MCNESELRIMREQMLQATEAAVRWRERYKDLLESVVKYRWAADYCADSQLWEPGKPCEVCSTVDGIEEGTCSDCCGRHLSQVIDSHLEKEHLSESALL